MKIRRPDILVRALGQGCPIYRGERPFPTGPSIVQKLSSTYQKKLKEVMILAKRTQLTFVSKSQNNFEIESTVSCDLLK
jgi:hypothetical protein